MLFILYVRRSCAQVRKLWHDSSSSSIQSTSKWEPSFFLGTELPKESDKSPNYNPCPRTNTKHSLIRSPAVVFIRLSAGLFHLREYKHSLKEYTSPSVSLEVLFVNLPNNPKINNNKILYTSFFLLPSLSFLNLKPFLKCFLFMILN